MHSVLVLRKADAKHLVNCISDSGERVKVVRTIAAAWIVATGLTAAPTGAETLALYNWGDYINPEILTAFTAETGIAVTLDSYSSNEEMLARLQAGATGYDMVFPSVWMQDVLLKLDLLHPTDINEAPDFANIDPASLRSRGDPEGRFCLPYAWGTVGIYYNEDVTGPIAGFADFFAIPGRTGGKISMPDDMREVLAAGLIMTGSPVNETDPARIQAATDYLIAHKKDVAAFTYDAMPLLLSGDLAAAHHFVGGNLYIRRHPNLKYIIPQEGASIYQENACVLKSAPNKQAARKFLEFLLDPGVAALNTSQQFNGTPNIPARALLPDDIRDDPMINPSPETMARLQIFEDPGPALRLYDRAWTAIRAAR